MIRTSLIATALTLVAACDKESQKPDDLPPPPQTQNATAAQPTETIAAPSPSGAVEIIPLQHASMIIKWEGITIAVDPVRGALDAAEGDEPRADLILVTDIHGDHFDAEAVASLRAENGVVVAPKAVVDQAGDALPDPTIVANGATKSVLDSKIDVTGVAMYNVKRKREDSGEPYHVKGRGNGYVLTMQEKRVYISGDTECVPEMKALEDIDIALVCMNLPYTMTPEEAAECVLEFEPDKVVPYHYRGQDPSKLKELLAAKPQIEIELLDWYPASDAPTGEEPKR